MCIPPSYGDLGKDARDIFNKGFGLVWFGLGLVKLDVKTKSCNGVEFSTSGSSNTDTGKFNWSGLHSDSEAWCEAYTVCSGRWEEH
uniref:Uncharacterized protein n=1 Tax=Catagonus wagneri TaxID=51154 RepID=A0A8C3WX16_9CETA